MSLHHASGTRRLLKPAGLEIRQADGGEPLRIEHRYAGLTDLTVDADARTFEGYGCVFGVVDSYRTVFERGCFAASLAEWRSKRAWPSFYLSHDWDQLIGQWTDMFEDNKGLYVKGRFIQSAWGDHARALVSEGIASGLSIGFVAVDSRVENEDDWEKRTRYITKADLWEISLVERPAVPGSGVTAIREDMSVREIERVLASIPGLPRSAAKAMASQWKPKGSQARDALPNPEGDEARDAPDPKAEAEAQAREARARQEAINRELTTLLQGATRALKS